MAAIDQLINDLRADGSVDSEGTFTLDREQARAKMQKFQLVDARRYVLELVQAAVLRDATAIAFEIDADDMRMRFDGLSFTAAELDDLYGSLFRDGDSRALRGVRQLALALNAALGMDPKYIHMRSGEVELRMVPGERDEIVVRDKPVEGTQIHVRQRLRMRVFVDFFLNLAGRIAEEQYLRERCRFSTVPITLDGTPISAGLGGGERGLAQLELQGKDFRGVLTIVDRDTSCAVRLLKDGVWIDDREPRDCGTNLIAVIEGDNLRKDVSQAKIVESAALLRIDAAIRSARWKLWKLAREQLQGDERERVRALIREQLLHFASRSELHDSPEALALAAELSWLDCRRGSQEVNLAELVKLVAAGSSLRYARGTYGELAPEGDPILLIFEAPEVEALGRLLGHELVEADDLLGRQRRRVLGRNAWLERKGEPVLPSHVEFAVRGPISAQLESGPVRGEVGLDLQELSSPSIAAPVHLFMYKDGCLLGRAELDLELPNLWLAIEAGFEPNLDYTDAVRNQEFIAILLRALASLHEPFAKVLHERESEPSTALLRGLVKRWLIALVDRKSQVSLLTRAGADVDPHFFVPVTKLLPGLSRQRLLGKRPDVLAGVPLFETLVGPRLSLAQLAAVIEAKGVLRYCESRPHDPRLVEPDVVFLGPGDRKLVRALFGERALEKWDPSAKQRELEFWDGARIELVGLRARAEQELQRAGLTPERWLVDLPEGPTRGFMVAVATMSSDELGEALGDIVVEVRHEARELCEVELDGFGLTRAVLEHPGLRPSASWDDVVRDAAFDEAIAAVRAAERELVRRAALGLAREDQRSQRLLARMLLHAAAERPPLRELVDEAPLLTTVAGKPLSLAQAAARVREHGKLDYAERELGSAPIDDPPIVSVDDDELAELQTILGEVLENAGPRVRHHRAFALLDDRPELREAKLDPAEVFASVELRGNGQVGELGLSNCREQPGLSLTLGLAGREIDVLFVESGVFVPVDAVVIDEELPLDADGHVEQRSKRVKNLIRQCRRRVPGVIELLCERWPELRGEPRERAWSVILQHLTAEAGQERRRAREEAWAAAAKLEGFRDVRGQRVNLARILAEHRSRPLDVLTTKPAIAAAELPELDRLILVVDAQELDCLEHYLDVRRLDEVWEAELAQLRELADAPKVESPNIHDVALVYRKAMVAGGLECELWLPRTSSVFEAVVQLVFARAGREIGRGRVGETLPCAGIVTGEGLVRFGAEIVLEHRQRSSLERQQVILYADLAKLVADGRVAKDDHERALEYLAWAAVSLDQGDPLRGHGKHALALRKALDEVVPPSLRAAVRRRLEPPEPTAPEPEPEPAAPEPEPAAAEPAVASEPAPQPAPEPVVELAEPNPPDSGREPQPTPQTRLLAALYEQLHWARSRHDLLDELLLNNMSISAWGPGELAILDRRLLINRDHPIVARLLGQDPHDPIDLSFLVAGLYSLLNYEAEDISDDHEREFVGQLAEALALSVRAQRGP